MSWSGHVRGAWLCGCVCPALLPSFPHGPNGHGRLQTQGCPVSLPLLPQLCMQVGRAGPSRWHPAACKLQTHAHLSQGNCTCSVRSGCSVQAGDTGTPPRKKSEHAGAWPRVSSGTWLVASIRFHVSLTVSRPLPSLSVSGFVTEPSLPPAPQPPARGACSLLCLPGFGPQCARAAVGVGVERGPGSRLAREELRGRALLAPLPPPLTPAGVGLPSAP